LPIGEFDEIMLVSPIAEQAFVGRLLFDLWFKWLRGFSPSHLSIREFLHAGDASPRANMTG
jgi:hypothetical protein